ncbi:[Fructose-bisphosphate aldolase]-lysine N-methyltransferase [Diplonema papillatum]|nr:[Fructose-bisphosphate aldolase]-lysine N-methyltransferase [Diplonema papillatum]
MKLRLPPSHLDPPELQQRKERLLVAAGLGSTEWTAAADVPREAVSRARVLCMDELELYRWNPFVAKEGRSSLAVGFVSHWNELKMVRMLKNTLERATDDAAVKGPVASWLQDHCDRMCRESANEPEKTNERWAPVTDEPHEELMRWLSAAAPWPCVTAPALFPETTGRGLVFTQDVRPPMPVVAVHRSLLFNAEAVDRHVLSSVFKELELDSDTAVLLLLIHERYVNPRGPWGAFVRLLPAEYSTLFQWSPADLAELAGTPLLSDTLEQKQKLQGFWDDLLPRLRKRPDVFDKAVFTFEKVLWARATFDSRGFIINIDGKAMTTLLPHAEYINHTDSAGHVSFRRFDAASQCVLLESLGECKSGEQARMNYGPMQNGELLTGYGFAIEDNPLESCPVGFELDDEDDLYTQKELALERLSIPSTHHLFAEGTPSHNLLAALRIAAAASEEEIEACVADDAALVAPVSDENEAGTKELLGAVVAQLSAQYPSSLEDDELLLEQVRAQGRKAHTEVMQTPHLELALIYRIGQKKLLRNALAWAEA